MIPVGEMTLFQNRLTLLLLFVFTLTLAHDHHNAFEEFQNHNHEEPHHQEQTYEEPHHQEQIYENPHQQEQSYEEQKHPDAVEAEPEMTDEERHLNEHLKEEGYLDPAKMKDSEKQYHYFLAHDYDNDEELDGTEIMQSFFHGANSPIFNEDELSGKIDYLLDNFDSDRNGKLSFAEFMVSSARFTGNTHT